MRRRSLANHLGRALAVPAVLATTLLWHVAPPAAADPTALRIDEVAGTFAEALSRDDRGTVLALFAPNAVVKERTAVLAAGLGRVSAWAAECLNGDFAVEPTSLALAGETSATYAFADSTGCYWRMRPGSQTAMSPGPDVNPAEGTLTLVVAQGRIETLTLTYSDAWRARFTRSVAAPLLAVPGRTLPATPTPEVAGIRLGAASPAAAPPPTIWMAAAGAVSILALLAGRRPRA